MAYTSNKNIARKTKLVFIGVAVLTVLAATFFHSFSKKTAIESAYSNLKTICELQINQLEYWLADEKNDALYIANNPFFVQYITDYLNKKSTESTHNLQLYMEQKKKEHGLVDMFLLTRTKKIIASTSDTIKLAPDSTMHAHSDSGYYSPAFYDALSQQLIIDFIQTIHKGDSLYYVVFRTPIAQAVHLQTTEYQSYKTIFMQYDSSALEAYTLQHDNSFVALHDSSFSQHALLHLYPQSEEVVICDMLTEHNTSTLLYIRKIQNSPWSIGASVEEKEVYESLRYNLLFVGIFIALILFFFIAAFAYIQSNRQMEFYKTLSEIQAQFKTIINSVNQGIIHTNNAGIILHINPQACSLTGWSSEESKGKYIHEVLQLIHENSRKPLHITTETTDPNEKSDLQNRAILVNKNMQEIAVSVHRNFIYTDSKTHDGCVYLFQSEQKEREYRRSIEETNKALSVLISNIPGVAFTLHKSDEWKFTYLSESIINITEYSANELMLQSDLAFMNLIHPDDKEKTLKQIQLQLEAKNTYFVEYRIITKSNVVRYIWGQGQMQPDRHTHTPSINGYIIDITELKTKEKELYKSKQLLQSVLDTIPLGVFWKDTQGKYISGNSYFLQSSKLTHSQLLGKTDYDMPWKLMADDFQAMDNKVLQTGKPIYNKEKRNTIKHDHVEWFKISKIPLYDEHNSIYALLGIFENITDEKLNLEKITESEELYRMQFEENKAIKFLVDPTTGNIINVNKTAVDIYGWTKDEFTQKNIYEIDALGPEKVMHLIRESDKQKLKKIETIHRKKSGEEIHVEIYGTEITLNDKKFIHNIVHDITDKKEAESTIRLQIHAIEQSPASILITNSKGIVKYVNPKFCETSGYSLREVIGNSSKMLRSTFHTPQFYEDIWKTISSGNDWSGEIYNKKKNGELYWEQVLISPIFNNEGEITHFLSIKEDITEKKNMLEELIRAKEKAEESNKLKSAFLANISHEIRTPMNGIIGFSEMFLDDNLSGDQRQEYARIVINSSKQLLGLVNDILDISKIEAGELNFNPEWFDLRIFLSEVYSFFEPQTLKKSLLFNLHISIDDEYTLCYADKNKLNQILVNLINNAIKFTHEGSIEFGCALTQSMYEFYVKDTGIGIPTTMHETIFERFRQAELDTTKIYGGTGLGLAISHKLVQLMGGTINLNSQPGEGSVFYFTLPATPYNASGVATKHYDFKKATILIAEDNDINYQLLEASLAKVNLTILRATTGEEAVELSIQDSKISCVLMDIRMPKMNGLEATKIIKSIRPTLPIIIQSAYSSHADRQAAYQAGCDNYMIKPIKKQELLICIESYMNL